MGHISGHHGRAPDAASTPRAMSPEERAELALEDAKRTLCVLASSDEGELRELFARVIREAERDVCGND